MHISLVTASFIAVAFCSWCLVSIRASVLNFFLLVSIVFLLTIYLISTRLEKSRVKDHILFISSVQQSELSVALPLHPCPIFITLCISFSFIFLPCLALCWCISNIMHLLHPLPGLLCGCLSFRYFIYVYVLRSWAKQLIDLKSYTALVIIISPNKKQV